MIQELRMNKNGELEGTVEMLQWDEMYTKDEVVSMLTDIQLEIEKSENCGKAFHLGLQMASNIIKQKINELKGAEK